jgi:hypothetical protein
MDIVSTRASVGLLAIALWGRRSLHRLASRVACRPTKTTDVNKSEITVVVEW